MQVPETEIIVTKDGAVPIASHAYPGNRPDVTQFQHVVTELTERYASIAKPGDELTLVYDAGQGTVANHEFMDESPLHFVGSLRPFDHPDLLAVAKRRYRTVDEKRFPGLRAFESRVTVFGHERRIVVTHSQRLHDKQVAGFAQTLAKARRQLAAITARLARGKGRKSKEAVAAEIASVLAPRWLDQVVSTTLHGEAPSELRLVWRTKPKAMTELEDEIFGKRILVTDREDWSIAQVVAGYRSQWNVEADFRQMKDPKVVSFSPMFHWTDQKIRVHVTHCVLALMTARLMVREAAQAKMAMSVRELLATLGGIEETVLLYQGDRGRPRARRMLTEMTPTQQRLYDLFDLDAYAPTR